MSTSRRPKAILYARLSVARDESSSIATQMADLEALAEREGWDIVARLEDEGLSGGVDRDNATDALDMLRGGKADVLAVWKFDRWSRQGLGVVAKLIEALDARDAAAQKRQTTAPALFVALRDGLRSDQPAWRIIASVLAEVARMERDATALRVRSAIAANKRKGRWTGGTAPMGYRSAPHPKGRGHGRVLEVNPEEAQILKAAAGRVVDNTSLYAVTEWLNGSSLRPRRAATWSVQSVMQMLTGPAIVGRVTLDGDVIRDHDGLPVEVWPPAIPVDLWHAVRATVDTRRAERPAPNERRRGRRARLLSGLARCADCEAPLYVRSASGRPAKGDGTATPSRAIYACSSKSNGRPCVGVSVTAARLEEHIVEEFLNLYGRFEVYVPVEHERPAADLVEAERALSDVNERLEDLELDEDAEADLLAHRAALRRRVRSLRADTASMTREVEFIATGELYNDVWHAAEGDIESQRSMLADVLDAIYVSKGKRGAHGLDTSRVSPHWRQGGGTVDADEGNSNGPGDPALRKAPRATQPWA
jgi:site-specific DNA recombinase